MLLAGFSTARVDVAKVGLVETSTYPSGMCCADAGVPITYEKAFAWSAQSLSVTSRCSTRP